MRARQRKLPPRPTSPTGRSRSRHDGGTIVEDDIQWDVDLKTWVRPNYYQPDIYMAWDPSTRKWR